MKTQIYVNLPVRDLPRSIDFFQKLDLRVNPDFTNDVAACLEVSETIYIMLLTHEKFREFTPKPISDATASTEVLIAISCESRGRVDDLVARALSAGGSTFYEPQDHGFMYQHGFQDPDGHIWELVFMEDEAEVG